MSIIEARELEKTYKGGVKAVRGIDLSIKKSEIFGFLGPNGAGKTTTVKMFATMLKPTAGTATVGGYDIVKDRAKVRQIIGFLPQEISVDDDLKGIENLELQASFFGISKTDAHKRAKELLELVDLYEARNRYVSTYSGGMRRRLDLITGLIHNPELLFLDEPTLGLDVQTRTKMWDYIANLRKEYEITIFLTTHYLEEADNLCDTVAIIDQGKIVASGTPAKLKAKVGFDIIEMVLVNPKALEEVLNNTGFSAIEYIGTNTVRIKVPESEIFLPELFHKINENKIKIEKVHVEKPSLDTVFLKYTGRAMRDRESEEDVRRLRTTIRRAR